MFSLFKVIINGILDYSDPEVQADVDHVMRKLENTTFIDPAYSESWLRDFLDFVDRNKDYEPIDISGEQIFIDNLERVCKQKLVWNTNSK